MAGRLSADKSDVSDNTDKTSALKLHAQSSDDIKILSALLQDALIAGADMVFDKAENTFMLVANRYCWELQVRRKIWHYRRCSHPWDDCR